MLTIKIGNIFDSKAKVLVNTVNCVGVMGKGIAEIFKKKYPTMFEEYRELCQQKMIHTGTLYPYYENKELKLLNFPTKNHWRSPSKVSYILEGLDWFINHYQELNIESIAFPPLGCGNGGLNWSIIGPLMVQKLEPLPIDIEIYAPFGTSKIETSIEYLKSQTIYMKTDGKKLRGIHQNWPLVLYLVQCLNKSKFSLPVGRTVFQKICYILERYGTDLGLTFVKGTYGPYSKDIKEMITVLSNTNLITENVVGQSIVLTVNESFTIDKEQFTQGDKENVNRTYQLFKRIKDTSQAELITTILYSFDQLNETEHTVTENALFDYIVEWKKRFNNPMDEERIRELIKYLSTRHFIQVDYSSDFIENLYIE